MIEELRQNQQPESSIQEPIEGLKALSLWQPWASLMQIGAKTVETRSWETTYRGPLLICSTKGGLSNKELKKLFTNFSFLDALVPLVRDIFHEKDTTDIIRDEIIEALPFGKALCIVDLVDVVPTESLVPQYELLIENETTFGDYSSGRYAWITKNLRIIKHTTITGRQGLFNVPVDFQKNFVPVT